MVSMKDVYAPLPAIDVPKVDARGRRRDQRPVTNVEVGEPIDRESLWVDEILIVSCPAELFVRILHWS